MLPAGFVLMSPWTDLTVSGKTHETKADVDPVLNQNYLNEMIENCTPIELITFKGCDFR